MCLGNEESIDLRGLLRSNCSDDEIKTAIIEQPVDQTREARF